MDGLEYPDSVVVAAPGEDLFDVVADVTRMGDWRPVC